MEYFDEEPTHHHLPPHGTVGIQKSWKNNNNRKKREEIFLLISQEKKKRCFTVSLIQRIIYFRLEKYKHLLWRKRWK